MDEMKMTNEEKLIKNIETLKLSFQFDWRDLSVSQMSMENINSINIKTHIKWRLSELKEFEINFSNKIFN